MGEPFGVDVGKRQLGSLVARLTANALPMPDPAPVMTATLPSNRFISCNFHVVDTDIE